MMKPCKLRRACTCGSQLGHIIGLTKLPHAAKIVCWECGKFQKWLAKSDLERAVKCGLVTAN